MMEPNDDANRSFATTRDESERDALDLVLPMIFGAVQGQLLAVAASLDLAEHLRDGALTPSRLASATGTEPRALGRVLRALAALGLVAGDAERGYACTPAGRLLRRDGAYSMHHYALMNNREWLVEVLPRLLDSVRSGRETFEDVHGTSCYAYLGAHPADAAIFNAALSELSRQDAIAMAHACDFSAVRRLVDVGGGEGLLVRELLDANPALSAVLLDLPEVVASAGGHLAAHVAAGRCEIVGADFRVGVPEGADLYLLKRVASTCPADHIEIVLRHIRAAIPGHGKLLIADPDPGTRYGALLDVLMLVTTGGELHGVRDIGALLAGAGFRLDRSLGTPTHLRIIEAVPA